MPTTSKEIIELLGRGQLPLRRSQARWLRVARGALHIRVCGPRKAGPLSSADRPEPVTQLVARVHSGTSVGRVGTQGLFAMNEAQVTEQS